MADVKDHLILNAAYTVDFYTHVHPHLLDVCALGICSF